MNVFLIVNIRPSLIHLHGLELLVVLSQKSLLFCTNRVSLVNLKWNSDRLLIVTKGFLKLLNQLVQIKLRWGELDNPGISSSACLCRTNLELHNNHVTLKLAKKVTSNLDLLKAPGPDYVPVVNFHTYYMSSLVIVWRNIFFQTFGSSDLVPVFVIRKVFEKLVNNSLVDYFETWGLFSDFMYVFRSSPSTAYQLQIFWQLYLIKILALLIGFGLLEL